MLSLEDFDGVFYHEGTKINLPFKFDWGLSPIFYVSATTKEPNFKQEIIIDHLKTLSLAIKLATEPTLINFLDSIGKEWGLEREIVQNTYIVYNLPKQWNEFGYQKMYLFEDVIKGFDLVFCLASHGEMGRTSITGVLYQASIIHSDPVLRKLFKKY